MPGDFQWAAGGSSLPPELWLLCGSVCFYQEPQGDVLFISLLESTEEAAQRICGVSLSVVFKTHLDTILYVLCALG